MSAAPKTSHSRSYEYSALDVVGEVVDEDALGRCQLELIAGG